MKKTVSFLLAALLSAAGCAGRHAAPTSAESPSDLSTVGIEARSYSFSPSFLTFHSGERVTLKVKNLSRAYHNITIEGPSGRTLRSVDLPPGETVPVEIVLKAQGDYIFHCDRLFHTSLGMKGRIRAE